VPEKTLPKDFLEKKEAGVGKTKKTASSHTWFSYQLFVLFPEVQFYFKFKYFI
jgi:hypothetical protein